MTDHQHLEILRKCAAELLACAILDLFPKTRLISSRISETGFSYDFLFQHSVDAEILPIVEERMRMLIYEDLPIKAMEMMRQNASQFLRHHKQPIRADLVNDCSDITVDVIQFGSLCNWCPGPYLSSTSEIGAIKLLDISFLEGSTVRIEGTACENREELKKLVKLLECAKQYDPALLGKSLDLFSENGSGGWDWHPQGNLLKDLIVSWLKDVHVGHGIQYVSTSTWVEVSQVSNYKNLLLNSVIINDRESVPTPSRHLSHAILFSKIHEDTSLPIRYAECDRIFLTPKQGREPELLNSIERIADQATIFCSKDQLLAELISSLHFIPQIRTIFGFMFQLVFNTRAKNALGNVADWERGAAVLKEALKATHLDYREAVSKEDLFGPSVSMYVQDGLGREWRLFHVAIDLVQPKRLQGKGDRDAPWMVTRSLFGSLERVIGLWLEKEAREQKKNVLSLSLPHDKKNFLEFLGESLKARLESA